MSDSAEVIRAKIVKLRKAYDSGVQTVEHGDTRTTWRSLDEFELILQRLENDLAVAEGRKRRSRVSYIKQSSKGF